MSLCVYLCECTWEYMGACMSTHICAVCMCESMCGCVSMCTCDTHACMWVNTCLRVSVVCACVGTVSGQLGRPRLQSFLRVEWPFPCWHELQPWLPGPPAVAVWWQGAVSPHPQGSGCVPGGTQCEGAVQTWELLSEGVPWSPMGSGNPGDCVFKRKPIYVAVGLRPWS